MKNEIGRVIDTGRPDIEPPGLDTLPPLRQSVNTNRINWADFPIAAAYPRNSRTGKFKRLQYYRGEK